MDVRVMHGQPKQLHWHLQLAIFRGGGLYYGRPVKAQTGPIVPGRSPVLAAEAPAEGARRRDPPIQRLPGLVQVGV